MDRTIGLLPIDVYYTTGWLLLGCGVLRYFGGWWDAHWHLIVGRDDFWIPPHVVGATTHGLSGLLCVGLGLWGTWRSRGLATRTTSATASLDEVVFLGILRAPLGVIVVGCGALTSFLGVPLDAYWHTIYGLDLTLWAPFHVMIMSGSAIQSVGALYFWGDLLRVASHGALERETRSARVGLMGAIMGNLFGLLWASQPGITQVPIAGLGPVHIMTYPVLLAFFVPWLLTGTSRTIPSRWSATAVALLLLGTLVLVGLVVPWATRAAAAILGWSVRPSWALGPVPLIALPGLPVLAAAVLTDLTQRQSPDRQLGSPLTCGAITGLLLWLVGGALASTTSTIAARHAAAIELRGIVIPPPASWTAIGLALPAALVAAALSGFIGHRLAETLQRGPSTAHPHHLTVAQRAVRVLTLCLAFAALPTIPPVAADHGGTGRTEERRAGPYRVTVNLAQDPARVDQPLRVVVSGVSLSAVRVTLVGRPLIGTNAEPTSAVQLTQVAGGLYAGTITFGVIGSWLLDIILDGADGREKTVVPIVVGRPTPIPLWFAWLIGFAPSLGLAWFGWWSWRRTRGRPAVLAG